MLLLETFEENVINLKKQWIIGVNHGQENPSLDYRLGYRYSHLAHTVPGRS